MVSSRDDFAKRTIEILADRAGNRCSNPTCRKPTSGPRTDPTKTINVGVAAHITAASEGGPRYDPTLSAEERKHPDNGIWLCQLCSKLIDNDPDRYSDDLLRRWKKRSEDEALAAIEQNPAVVNVSPLSQSLKAPSSSVCMSIDALRAKIMASSPDDWSYDDSLGVYVYREDVLLQFRQRRESEKQSFPEPWAQRFADPNAYLDIYDLYYNNTRVDYYIFVAVDGFRMTLPLPRFGNRRISWEQYNVGRIVNIKNRGWGLGFDDYLKHARVVVDNEIEYLG
jgi:hypothetical protein